MKSYSIVILLLFLVSQSSFAATVDFDFNSMVRDINYQYELHPNYTFENMCIGTLSMTITIPENTEQVYFCWTTSSRYPPRIFNRKSIDIFDKSCVKTVVEGVKAYTHFKVEFRIDGDLYETSDFAVDDYMDPKDLEYLENFQINDVDNIIEETPIIEFSNRTLKIKSDEIIPLTINSIDGKVVFNNYINQYAEIELYSGLFIITYGNINHLTIKKIFIK